MCDLLLVCIFGSGGIGLINQFRQGGATRGGDVVHEVQFRQRMNTQSLTQLITQKAGSSLKAFKCVLYSGRIINERGEEDFSVRVVWGELNFGQCDHANARIFEFHGDQFCEIALDLVCDALASAGDGFAVLGHGLMEFKDEVQRHWIPAYAGMTFEELLVSQSSSPACDECYVGGSHATRVPHSLPAEAGIQRLHL